ncbi:WhiB family transcriptional regulator [Streptomyces sp. NPDC048629]|uniref:WhiB family transcriptional regulator n=1 Tax=Streptomyces sp. NPDC048629 TaxID=3154824 RepID=UPI003446FB57
MRDVFRTAGRWPVPPTTKPACRDAEPGLFHPDRPGGPLPPDKVTAAKAVCRRCPVLSDCLTLAVRFRETEGIWGGTTPKERRWLRVQADRMHTLGPLLQRLRTGEAPVHVDPLDRPAVVHRLIAGGWDVNRIAATLAVSPAAVRTAHRRGVLVASYAEALKRAGSPRAA